MVSADVVLSILPPSLWLMKLCCRQRRGLGAFFILHLVKSDGSASVCACRNQNVIQTQRARLNVGESALNLSKDPLRTTRTWARSKNSQSRQLLKRFACFTSAHSLPIPSRLHATWWGGGSKPTSMQYFNTCCAVNCDKSAELTPNLLPYLDTVIEASAPLHPQTSQTPTKQAHTVPTTGSLQ